MISAASDVDISPFSKIADNKKGMYSYLNLCALFLHTYVHSNNCTQPVRNLYIVQVLYSLWRMCWPIGGNVVAILLGTFFDTFLMIWLVVHC
jgi:hypothetical protein